MRLNLLILACMLASWGTTDAAAPAPSADCSTLVMDNMISCMQFLSNTGTEAKPDDSCCSGLKIVMKTDTDCLCYAIKSAPSLGLDLNMTRAAELASDCRIDNAPPISNCAANPPSLPAQPPAEVPSDGPGPSPSPSKPKSDAQSISATFSVIFTQLVYSIIFIGLA